MRRFFAALSSIALISVVVSACGSSKETPDAAVVASLEEVCRDLVKSSCDAISTCCNNGATFDAFECTRASLGNCLNQYDSEGVHAGTVIYDANAARTCRGGAAAACPSAATGASSEPDEAVRIACGNIVVGYRPLGAECTADTQCASVGAGAYPDCYNGAGAGSGGGVCARHVFGDTCGFSADLLTYTECHAGSYCSRTTPCGGSTGAQQGKARFEFTGACLTPAKEGETCGAPQGPCTGAGTTTPVPCDKGLSCAPSLMGGGGSKCVKPHELGQDCKDTFLCAPGLSCNGQSGKCEAQTGVPTTGDGAYCFKPAGSTGSGGAGGFGAGGTGSGGFGATPGGGGFAGGK